MSRAHGIRAQTLVDLRLEWEKRDDAAGPARDRPGAPRAPGPDLRADVVDQRDPVSLETARQEAMKVGKIDEHRAVGTALAGGGLETPEGSPQRRKLFEDFGDSHNRKLLREDHPIESGRSQTPSAHSKCGETRSLPAQGGQQARAMPVARGLAARDQEIQRVNSLQSTVSGPAFPWIRSPLSTVDCQLSTVR